MIAKRGNSFTVRVQHQGRRKWVGSFPTKREARIAERDAQALLEADHQPSATTIAEFVDFYLKGHEERVKPSTYNTSRLALTRFVEDFGHRTPDSITPMEAEAWARANRHRVQRVSSVMNDAVRKQLCPSNPFRGYGSKGRGRKDITPLTRDELAHLANCAERALGQEFGPMFKAFVLFAGWTGFRAGELFALEWRDLDFENRRVNLRRQAYDGVVQTLKSGEPERFLPQEAIDAVRNLERDGMLVFRGETGRRLCRTALKNAWNKVEVLYGPRVTAHELRHSLAYHLYVEKGLPADVVAVQLGHDGPDQILRLYGHGKVGALDRLEAALSRKVTPLKSLEVVKDERKRGTA